MKPTVVLSEKKIHHLADNDTFLKALKPLDISHRVNHKHPENLLIPVLNTTMEKVSMKKYTILGKLKPLNIDGCEVNKISWSKLDSYVKTFDDSMLPSIQLSQCCNPTPVKST